MSYQHQSGIAIQSKWINTGLGNIGATTISNAQVQLSSNLSFDGLTVKNYFELPKALICKGVATTPYLAFGIGAGWQTWSRTEFLTSQIQQGQFGCAGLNARQKISANLMWMADLGFRIRSAFPDPGLNILLGCKYNQWGTG